MKPTLTTIEGIDGAGKTTVQNALLDIKDNPVLTTEPNDSNITQSSWSSTNWFGEQVRTAIGTDETDPLAVFLYFLADHSYHYENTIAPALNAGKDVICDRYIGSRYAYQSIALDDRVEGNTINYLSTIHESELKIDTAHPVVENILSTATEQIPSNSIDNTPLVGRYAFGLAENPQYFPEGLTNPEDDFPGLTVLDEPASWSKLPDHTILLDLPASTALERLGKDAEKEVFEKQAFLEEVRTRYKDVAKRNPNQFTTIDATKSKGEVVDEVLTLFK